MTTDITQTADRLLTVRDLAARWRCSVESVQRLARDGQLPRIWLGPQTARYRLGDVTAFEDARVHRGPITSAEAAAQ